MGPRRRMAGGLRREKLPAGDASLPKQDLARRLVLWLSPHFLSPSDAATGRVRHKQSALLAGIGR